MTPSQQWGQVKNGPLLAAVDWVNIDDNDTVRKFGCAFRRDLKR
jgi:hypothetical protein